MSYAKDGIKRRVVVFPLSGGACTVPAVLDFTRSRPGAAKTGPAAVPTKTGAALRFRATASGRSYVPVDPALLVLHLSFGEAGRICLVSEALALFIGRCCAVSGAGGRKRLAVGGDPAVTTRAVCRGTELNAEPRAFFHAKQCHVRGCTAPVVAGTCAPPTTTLRCQGALSSGKRCSCRRCGARGRCRRARPGVWRLRGPLGVACRVALVGAADGRAARLYFVNHAVDALPLIAMGTASADWWRRWCTAPTPRRREHRRFTMRTCSSRLSGRSGPRCRCWPATRRAVWRRCTSTGCRGRVRCAAAVRPRPCPVLQDAGAAQARGVCWTPGALCSTVVPDLGEEPVAVVFNVVALCALSRIFGSLGEFSFTVLTGTLEVPDGALVLDAAERSI